MNLLGLIFCGGQSSGMGSDKGLLEYQSKSGAQHAIDRFSALAGAAKLSVNQQDKKEVSHL